MFRVPRMRVMEDQRGTSLIEFALILPFLLVITFTVVDLSRAFHVRSILNSAAREGARTAIGLGVPAGGVGSDTLSPDYQQVRSRVREVLSDAGLTSSLIQVEGPDGQNQITVTVTNSFNWLYLGAFNQFAPGTFTNPQALTAKAVYQRIG